jgi:hypothetical protein
MTEIVYLLERYGNRCKETEMKTIDAPICAAESQRAA